MRKTRQYAAMGRLAVSGWILAVVGCGGGESAGSDPVARSQTETEAKKAMVSTSKKKTEGVSQQQSTTNAMAVGARQQQRKGKGR